MCGECADAVRVEHFLGIAVVGGHERDSTATAGCPDDAATVEEVSDVRVLLRLSCMELTDAVLCEHLGQDHLYTLLRKNDGEVEVLSVLRHRRQVGFQLAELLGELTCPVGAEVEKDRGV